MDYLKPRVIEHVETDALLDIPIACYGPQRVKSTHTRNEYRLYGGYSLVAIYAPLAEVCHLALFDTDKITDVNKVHWVVSARTSGRVYFNGLLEDGRRIYLHRLLTAFPAGKVDHAEHCWRDLRLDRLRAVDGSINNLNSTVPLHESLSGIRGVHAVVRDGNVVAWTGRVRHNGGSWSKNFEADAMDAAAAWVTNRRSEVIEAALAALPYKEIVPARFELGEGREVLSLAAD